jgi:hypothetical protein
MFRFAMRFLSSLLLFFLLVSGLPVQAQTVTELPRLFRMADGAYYDPVSGKRASSETALYALLGIGTMPSPTSKRSEMNQFALKQAINRAESMLRASLVETTPPIMIPSASVNTAWFPITLAVWQPETDQIVLKRYLRQLKNVKNIDGTVARDIEVLRSNGVNSEYRVLAPTGGIVVANIHPILQRESATTVSLQPRIYVPYSDALHTSAMVSSGQTYLDTVVDDVYRDLRSRSIRSRAFSDKLIADVVTPELVKAIAIIEYVDAQDIQNEPVRTAEAFFVTVGGNEEDSYIYSRSTAGALGLVQFIPSTYAFLVQKRPDLGLIPAFEQGMRDPENAIKAQIGYLDLLITEMPEITRAVFESQRSQVYEYLVAAYNGGSGRSRRAIPTWNAAVQGGQIQTLRALERQHLALDGRMAVLNKKIKGTKVAATVKKLKTEFAVVKKEHDRVAADEAWYQKFALREETRTYVLKYRETLIAMHQINQKVQLATKKN